ncbi:S-layer homology domain-containing protein [Citricoccus sp.]|uniref:S-layer homology domain-containing protein n=1 Tax=Citricoccus sp. TaxID=1978372 RepID=UPI0028BE6874|nr:S-layer homology domain-containing protein [Citricoccus sp.]
MSRTLHPVLKAGAATALALTLTATTVLPATAMPVVPDTTAAPSVATATGESAVDPAVESGEVASEIEGAGEQSIALGGIDAEALPEVPDTPEVAPGPDVTEAPDTRSPESTQAPDSTPVPSSTVTPDIAEPSASSTPAASEAATESAAAGSEATEPEVALMSSTLSAASAPASGTAPKSTDSESRPSDVVIRDLRAKAEGTAAATDTAANAPAAPEAEELTDSVFDVALSSTQDVEVERIAALTRPVETMDFIVAGVTWDITEADPVTDVSLRVREAGEWTDWNSMEIHDGDEAPHADRVGTEPLISSGGDAIQARVTTADGEVPAGLELELIDPGTAETDGKLEAASSASGDLAEIEQQAGLASQESASSAQSAAAVPAAALGTGSGAAFTPAVHHQQGLITGTAQATATANTSADAIKPKVITRAQWGANESWVNDWGTPSTDLQAMYVHHTAGSNNYTESGAYAQIRGIYSYHARSLAWGDIGYQFLVDKYGNIFQGRRGSIEKPVQGAQAGGFNTDTIGISAMGNYDVASAPAPMVRAIEKVLAWQAYRYDVDPSATVTLTQRGKGTARWSDGTRVTVPTILGHKVTNSTACPGRYLDAQLPTIRKNVDRLVAAAGANQKPGTPSLPSNHYRLSSPGTQATAYWNAVSGADQYQIMYRAVPQGGGAVSSQAWIAGKTMTGTNTLLSNTPGETAQYAVRALRGGVAGPQRYLGQHTAPLSWSDSDIFYGNGTTRTSGGVQANATGEAIRIENAGQANRVVVTAQVSSGTANIRVERGGKRAGRLQIRAGGPTVCAVTVGQGSNIRLELENNATVTYTSVALTRSGQTRDLATTASRCEATFSDIDTDDAAFQAVDWMKWSGVSTGYAGDNTYRMGRSISRGESVAFLYRYMEPKHTPAAKQPFKDVVKSNSFYGAISWAKDANVARGEAGGAFGVYDNVTRGEFASFLYRAAKPKWSTPKVKSFKDVPVGSTHHAAIAWMKDAGLTTGYTDGNFRQHQSITRGEVARILYRFDQG